MGGCTAQTEVAFPLLTQQPQVRFMHRILEILYRCCIDLSMAWLEGSEQRLENVDRIRLVLAS